MCVWVCGCVVVCVCFWVGDRVAGVFCACALRGGLWLWRVGGGECVGVWVGVCECVSVGEWMGG